LDSVLSKLPKQTDPNVIVGFDTADDAGVYQLNPDLALVQTVDFFTPIVDDPYTFGQIAAANSLSDVYAMGGRPISALAIVGFPNTGRDTGILEKILEGGLAKMQEAPCSVIGGHSIGDEEIKFGYAVTGLVHPGRVLTNAKARPGDRLVLTKRLGTGIIATAVKNNRASERSAQAAIESMCELNRSASEAALEFAAHSATDITGFGLLGHARQMAIASGVSLVIDSARVEFLPEAVDYSHQGQLPGGLKRNSDFLSGCVQFLDGVSPEVQNLLYDPQTSGGLLLAVEAAQVAGLIKALRVRAILGQEIGEVVAKAQPLILVRQG
jgi:selenide, water dikinase